MGNWHPIESIKKATPASKGKWICVGLAAIITGLATLFDHKTKEEEYSRKLDKEIERQTRKLLEGKEE